MGSAFPYPTEIIEQVRAHEHLVLLLDYHSTFAPFAATPDDDFSDEFLFSTRHLGEHRGTSDSIQVTHRIDWMIFVVHETRGDGWWFEKLCQLLRIALSPKRFRCTSIERCVFARTV